MVLLKVYSFGHGKLKGQGAGGGARKAARTSSPKGSGVGRPPRDSLPLPSAEVDFGGLQNKSRGTRQRFAKQRAILHETNRTALSLNQLYGAGSFELHKHRAFSEGLGRAVGIS